MNMITPSLCKAVMRLKTDSDFRLFMSWLAESLDQANLDSAKPIPAEDAFRSQGERHTLLKIIDAVNNVEATRDRFDASAKTMSAGSSFE